MPVCEEYLPITHGAGNTLSLATATDPFVL